MSELELVFDTESSERSEKQFSESDLFVDNCISWEFSSLDEISGVKSESEWQDKSRRGGGGGTGTNVASVTDETMPGRVWGITEFEANLSNISLKFIFFLILTL